MRKSFFIAVLGLLLALPALGFGQLTISGGGGGGSTSFSSQYSTLNNALLDQILTLAAPTFGFTGPSFINLYLTCGCVTVEQTGPSTYFVTYGGLGIQIIIEGSRSSGRLPSYTLPASTKH
jgi:hypothetical protein